MNRRELLKAGTAISIATLTAPYSNRLFAQSSKGFQPIDPAINTRVSDKVEVIEYFWFGCPHCFAFEPAINEWKNNDKPDYVEFVREAPPLNPAWEPHSRAFYAAELMGVTESFFDPMFNAIHREGRSLRSHEDIVDFVNSLEINGEEFETTMNSFAVNTRIDQSMQMAAAAGLGGVPSIVVNGKYLASASLAGSHENIIRVINELSASEFELLDAG